MAPLVVAELRPHMANLMGNVGFRALLSRSLVMARTEAPWLQAVRVKGDGTLEGFDELADQVGRDDFFNGNMVLLAQLLGLLSTFIGEGLTMRMMRDVWPALSFTDLNPGNGDAAS